MTDTTMANTPWIRRLGAALLGTFALGAAAQTQAPGVASTTSSPVTT